MRDLPLVFPQLHGVYQTWTPIAEALLRVIVGLALVPHGLRNTFNFFPTTGQPLRSIRRWPTTWTRKAIARACCGRR